MTSGACLGPFEILARILGGGSGEVHPKFRWLNRFEDLKQRVLGSSAGRLV
jgi:hypothetical protein